MKNQAKPSGTTVFPVLPLRDTVVFPGTVVPLFVGRRRLIDALEQAMGADKQVVLVAQLNPNDDNPAAAAIYRIGTRASVLELTTLPDGTVKVQVEGLRRVRIVRYTDNASMFEAEIGLVAEDGADKAGIAALARLALVQFEFYVGLETRVGPAAIASLAALERLDDHAKLADTIASHLAMPVADKQALLEITNVSDRLESLCARMKTMIALLRQ